MVHNGTDNPHKSLISNHLECFNCIMVKYSKMLKDMMIMTMMIMGRSRRKRETRSTFFRLYNLFSGLFVSVISTHNKVEKGLVLCHIFVFVFTITKTFEFAKSSDFKVFC